MQNKLCAITLFKRLLLLCTVTDGLGNYKKGGNLNAIWDSGKLGINFLICRIQFKLSQYKMISDLMTFDQL